MMTRLVSAVADGVLAVAVLAVAIGVVLLGSDILITIQKLHW